MTLIKQKNTLLITAIALGVLLNPLNSSMIAVALSRMETAFHLNFVSLSWLISTYYLGSAVAQPVMGKLGDMFGHKRLFLTGLALIALASILAPFSPGFIWLIVFRMIQAVGSSALFPSGMAMIRTSIHKNQARALSLLAVFSSTSAAFGPTIGGLLIHHWDWEAIFLINFPFIILSVVLSIAVLPNDERTKWQWNRIDWAGIALFSSGMVMAILFLLSLKGPVNWWALGLSVIAFILLIRIEKKRDEPLINIKMLSRNKNIGLIYIQFICINLIFYSIFFGMPTYLQQAMHYNEQQTGLIMLTLAGFGVIITPVTGRWIDKSGSKPPLLVGALSVMIGTALLLTLTSHTSLIWLLVVLSVLGVSNGFNNISMQTALYAFVSKEETGSASGLFMTSRYLGTILSSSLLGVMFDKHINSTHLHVVAVVCLVFCVFILGLTLRLPRNSRNVA